MKVYRLEFPQPDGRWVGPYTAEYLTERAFAIRDIMHETHRRSEFKRPWLRARVFRRPARVDRVVCACPSEQSLRDWFGTFFTALLEEGGQVGVYEVPEAAVAYEDHQQIAYRQRHARCLAREGYLVEESTIEFRQRRRIGLI